MQLPALTTLIVNALEELKATDIQRLDVTDIASYTDLIVIASGSSTRQVKALAERLVERCKEAGVRPLGVEGTNDAEWVLVDLGDAVVHIMLPKVRDFYSLDKLWAQPQAGQTADEADTASDGALLG